MKINIDGPKGTGKSTLSALFRESLNARHEYVSYKRVYNVDEYVRLINLNDSRDLIMERGILSSWIYTWLRDGVFEGNGWFKPAHMSDFKRVIDEFDAFIVFYSSDPDVLLSRIDERDTLTGKGADDREREEIARTSELFRLFAEFLRDYCDCLNIEVIDVAKDSRTAKEIYYDVIAQIPDKAIIPFNNL